MRVNGGMIKQKGREFIRIWMGPSTLASGKKINSMEMERKVGLMELYMKDNIIWGKNKGREIFSGVMEVYIKDSLYIIIL
jgi:hypothetical protein